MKKFRVTVNGEVYEVEIEEGVSAADAQDCAVAEAKPEVEKQAAPAGKESVTSPMQGTILSVNVKPGDRVKAGQVLMILEAMKMENEIMAPVAGLVTSVEAAAGAAVEAGKLLCIIEG
ncbi:MAG: biotin/lipoyl-binding protein [Clostridia bacterium]|nr:biotin/lipoyl-binding protein [Clostridia bacterium]